MEIYYDGKYEVIHPNLSKVADLTENSLKMILDDPPL